MNEKNEVTELIALINKHINILKKISDYYNKFLIEEFQKEKKKQSDAIVLTELITDYYTCLETLFLRISQFFENNLHKERWHQNLLQNMTLSIPETREPVISEKTYKILFELLKFRHFKRYYFDLNYDWDKLEFLMKKFIELRDLLDTDIKHFIDFLNKLIN